MSKRMAHCPIGFGNIRHRPTGKRSGYDLSPLKDTEVAMPRITLYVPNQRRQIVRGTF
jgi:hypothetical protein